MSEQYHIKGWQKLINDVVIGIAYFRTVDQPWYICDFEPTATFEKYRAIFDTYATLINNPEDAPTELDPDVYYEMNIENLDMKLFPFGEVWRGAIFVAQIYDGREAWLRPL